MERGRGGLRGLARWEGWLDEDQRVPPAEQLLRGQAEPSAGRSARQPSNPERIGPERVAGATAHPLYSLIPNVLSIWDSPTAVTMLITIGMAASIALLIGWHDRIAALMLCYVWTCFYIRSPSGMGTKASRR